MGETVYEWRSGARLPSVSAQPVGERLHALREQHGRLTAAVVVADASAEDSVLHPYFEWDDVVAARLHREEKARLLMRSILVRAVLFPDQEPELVRAFVAVNLEDADTSYEPISVVLAEPGFRAQVIAGALQELRSWREKYRGYPELAAVFEAMDRAGRELIPV